MDVIYANELREELGVLFAYYFDLSYGSDENSFSIEMDLSDSVLKKDYYLFVEGTEYGGVIDTMQLNTDKRAIIYSGRTWHGILASKIIQPSTGEDYKTVSGDLNTIISDLLNEYGLDDLFSASEPCGVTVTNYQFDRYVDLYTGIAKMVKNKGMKLEISFYDFNITINAVPIVDYSNDDSFDSDVFTLDVKRTWNPVNHLIVLGKGDLKEREVLHLYADESGNVSKTQTLFDIDERVMTYDLKSTPNEELEQKGVEKLISYQAQDIVKASLKELDEVYDIGDIVGAIEHNTGTRISEAITQKIVNIKNGIISVNYKIGG